MIPPTFKPKVGETMTISVPTNFNKLYADFVKDYGYEPWYDKKLDLWYASYFVDKKATIIKVSPKGFIVTVQDEDGRIIRYRYSSGFYFIDHRDMILFT